MANSKYTSSNGMEAKSDQLECQEDFISLSEVASCSYEARKCGIRNGMFLGEAKTLCRNLQLIPYNFDGYREVAFILYDTVASYTLNIEAVSCDELYVDCTEILRENDISALEFAKILRNEIKEKTGCNCSAGLASNMLLARLATRRAKPNNQFYLTHGAVDNFMSEQAVADIPGVGWSLSSRLQAMGIRKCSELQKISLASLRTEFGNKTGTMLSEMSRGIDKRKITFDKVRKSVSAEVNYGIRFTQDFEAFKFISELSDEVCKRLHEIEMVGKTITLKLKVRKKSAPVETSKFMGHGICDNISRSASLLTATDEANAINQQVKLLLKAMKIPVSDLRGMGIQIHRLESATNKSRTDTCNIFRYLKHDKSTEKSELSEIQTSSSTVNRELETGDKNNGISLKNKLSPLKVRKSPQKTAKSSPKVNKILQRLQKNSAEDNRNAKNHSTVERFTTYETPDLKWFLPKEKEKSDHVKAEEVEESVNLCGETELCTIRSLFKEWIISCKDPHASDIDIISNYFKKLAVGKNLELVTILLKYLHRLILFTGNESWKNAYDTLLEDVQLVIVSLFDSPLKI